MSIKAFDETWEQIHSTVRWGEYPSEDVIRFCAKNYYAISPRKSVRILDFGCGGGSHTWYLAREGFDTYAFDGSSSAVHNTECLLKRDGLKANLRVLDGVAVNYEDDFFDAIIDNVCIYANTLENIMQMYKECYRILKPKGKLFTSVFSTETTGYGSGTMIEKDTYRDMTTGRLQGRGMAHFWNKDDLLRVLTECGFLNLEIQHNIYDYGVNVIGMYIVVGEKIGFDDFVVGRLKYEYL